MRCEMIITLQINGILGNVTSEIIPWTSIFVVHDWCKFKTNNCHGQYAMVNIYSCDQSKSVKGGGGGGVLIMCVNYFN